MLAAGEADSSRARDALATLCEAYWYPLYAFIRRQGSTQDEARDLTQGYFLQFLEKGFLKSVRPEAGLFRSFLLASVKHFLSNERDRERALKRGGGKLPIRLELDAAEGRYRMDVADAALTPDRLFERQWAMTVLGRRSPCVTSSIDPVKRRFEPSADVAARGVDDIRRSTDAAHRRRRARLERVGCESRRPPSAPTLRAGAARGRRSDGGQSRRHRRRDSLHAGVAGVGIGQKPPPEAAAISNLSLRSLLSTARGGP